MPAGAGGAGFAYAFSGARDTAERSSAQSLGGYRPRVGPGVFLKFPHRWRDQRGSLRSSGGLRSACLPGQAGRASAVPCAAGGAGCAAPAAYGAFPGEGCTEGAGGAAVGAGPGLSSARPAALPFPLEGSAGEGEEPAKGPRAMFSGLCRAADAGRGQRRAHVEAGCVAGVGRAGRPARQAVFRVVPERLRLAAERGRSGFCFPNEG